MKATRLFGALLPMAVFFVAAVVQAGDPKQEPSVPLGAVVDLFDGVRIRNIVVAADGSVLAFGKSGNLLRRSTDGGQTWSDAQQVADAARGSAIVDQGTGHVMVVDPRAVSLWRSSDHGQTWRHEEILARIIRHCGNFLASEGI